MQYFASQATHDGFLERLRTSVLAVLPFYPKRRGCEIRPAVEPHARPACRRILPSLDWPATLLTRTDLFCSQATMLMMPFRGVRNQYSSAAQHGSAANAQFSVREGFLRCFARCAATNLAKIVRALQAR